MGRLLGRGATHGELPPLATACAPVRRREGPLHAPAVLRSSPWTCHDGSIRASCPSSAGQRIPVRGRAVMEARRWTAAREGCGRCRGLGPARADHSVYVERCARELGAPPPHHAFTVTAAPALRQRPGRSAAGGAQDVVHFAYVTACRPDLALCLLLGSPEDAALPDFPFLLAASKAGANPSRGSGALH